MKCNRFYSLHLVRLPPPPHKTVKILTNTFLKGILEKYSNQKLWASYLNSLDFNFFICKIERMDYMIKFLSSEP